MQNNRFLRKVGIYSSRGECVSSVSVRSKRQGDQRHGGAENKEARTVRPHYNNYLTASVLVACCLG
jgi:hypothetical protein